jgi:hypothetical protein
MQDWETILRRGFESKELDYKGPCAWDEGDKKSCCELVKDILAVANTKGGWVAVGVSETPTGFSWDGLTEDQCKSFETSRLNRFLQNYADPPINTHVIKHTSQGKNFVVIEIPRFPDTPHICQKDYPNVLAAGAVYVRTDNNESARVSSSVDMRAIIEHATRNRGDQLLASFRAVLTGTQQPAVAPADLEQFDTQARDATTRSKELISNDLASLALGFRETVIHPLKFERFRFTIQQLEQMAEAASVTYRGWPYIFYTEKRADLIRHLDDSLEMSLNEQEAFQFWRLYRSGCLYVNEMFQEDERCFRSSVRSLEADLAWEEVKHGVFPASPKPGKLLGGITFAYTCAEAVQCLVDLYTGPLPDDQLVRLQMRLRGVQGRHMAIVRGNSYASTPWQCNTDQIVYEQQHTLADWRAGVIPHAFELLKYVNQKFNAPPPSYDEVAAAMQRLLSRQL